MANSRPFLQWSFLSSRVARRVFRTLSICSLLPVATFAMFSWAQVREQLENDASRLLSESLRESVFAIVGRLRLADEVFQWAIHRKSLDASDQTLQNARIFRSVSTAGPGDPELASLAPGDRSTLAIGEAVTLAETGRDGPRVLLVRRADSVHWIAEIDPVFLFEPDRYSERSRFSLVDANGQHIVVLPKSAKPPRTRAEAPAPTGETTRDALLTVSRTLPVGGNHEGGVWVASLSRPVRDIRRPLREFETNFPWVVGISLCVALLLSLTQIRRTLVPIDSLMSGARRIADGDFDTPVELSTNDEFESLANAFNEMGSVIGEQILVLTTMNTIGASLSAEMDADRLIQLILSGSMRVTRAAGGVVLLGGDATGPVPVLTSSRYSRLHSDDGEHSILASVFENQAASCLEQHRVLRTELQRTDQVLQPTQTAAIERWLGERATECLSLPMICEGNERIGALLLFRTGAEQFSNDDTALASSIASQAAVAIRKGQLVENFRDLFEGVVNLTAQAIDEKSPYTGDHCRKVPILTELIAEAVCADSSGPLKDFEMTAEERYELRIAALLHDCGKVATPVHVMDKATKLDTISDRIEVIDTRFAVLRAEARYRSLKRQLAGLGTALREDQELVRELADLDDDLRFVRACNIGGERMSDEDCERILQIAMHRRWRDPSDLRREVLSESDLSNLTIRRGTLNKAERTIIQDHVALTMKMLKGLPWPRGLQNVSAIAGAHHERMDGTGYPLGLHGSELSIQARILGLADVFEALTAKSRPYKPGKSLSETLDILERMAAEGHIDPRLYELFLRENLHLRYAAEHVAPEQIDVAHQAMIERLTDPTAPRGAEFGRH